MDSAPASQKTILMVEDDVLLSDLLARKLSEKFKLLYVPTAEAAIEILKTQTPDAILLDIILPGMDGYEVLKQAKADPKTANAPVVVLSNLSQPSDMAKAKQLGAAEFVVKVTLLPGEVVDLLERVIAREGQRKS